MGSAHRVLSVKDGKWKAPPSEQGCQGKSWARVHPEGVWPPGADWELKVALEKNLKVASCC